MAKENSDKHASREGEDGGEPEPGESISVLKKLKKWGDYASIGEPVGKFIPCKTPLSKDLLTSVLLPEPPKNALTLDSLLLSQRDQGRRIGFIIDLSNHPCLYENDIKSYKDVKYHHVRLVAKVVPPPDFVAEVRRMAEAFMAERPDDHIAIHCAYGFNRTGFVVCACLIEIYGLTVSQALEAFAAARPPGVKHEAFMDELYRRYGGQDSRLSQHQPVRDSSFHSQPCSLTTDGPSVSGAPSAEGASVAVGTSPASHLPLVHSSPELLSGFGTASIQQQQQHQPPSGHPLSPTSIQQQQQQQQQHQLSSESNPPSPPPPTQPDSQQPNPPQTTTTTTSPAKPPNLLNFFQRHLKLPLHTPSPPTKHTLPSVMRKSTPSGRTHPTNQPPRSSPPPSPSASFTAQHSTRPSFSPFSPAPHPTPPHDQHAHKTKTVPLTAAAIQQWSAQASKSPLYSAFRSNAASEITSMAGSMDDWMSQSQHGGGGGGGYDASSGPPGVGVHGHQHVGASDVHPGVLPSLNEEVDDANPDSPVAPLPHEKSARASHEAAGQQEQQQKEAEVERVPSNASSIGNWLDAYLDQQVTLSRAGTLAADPVAQQQQQQEQLQEEVLGGGAA